MLLDQYTDDFIADRIRWGAKKHNLPSGDTYFFAAAPTEVVKSFEASGSQNIGIPVLVFGSDTQRWTILGTQAAVSSHGDTFHICKLASIADFKKPQSEKMQAEFLDVVLKDSSWVRLWAPCGKEFFALWNILLALSRRK